MKDLHRLQPSLRLEDLKGVLAPPRLLAAIEPRPSLFKDLVFGTEPNWFDAEVFRPSGRSPAVGRAMGAGVGTRDLQLR